MYVKRKPLLYFLYAFILLTLLSCKMTEDLSSTGDEALTDVETLKTLGFQTDLSGSTDAEGGLLSDSYHPLRKKVSYYNKVSELFAVGVKYDSGNDKIYNHFFMDDFTDNPSVNTIMGGTPNKSWDQNPLTICGADIDGDFIEEGIAVVFNPSTSENLYIHIFDKEEGKDWDHSVETIDFGFTIPLRGNYDVYYHYVMSMESGDLDGDGRDELVCFLGNNLIVYEYLNSEFRILYSETFPPGSDKEYTLRGCVGDINVNGLDNIIVTHGLDHVPEAEFYIYEYESNSMARIKEDNIQIVGYNLQTANVDMGDVDGDGLPELVFAGEGEGSDCHMIIADDYTTDYTFFNTVVSQSYDWDDHRVIAVEVFHADPITVNPAEEILFLKHLYRLDSNGDLEQMGEIGEYRKDIVTTGDIDNDGAEEIVSQRGYDIWVADYSSGAWSQKKWSDADQEYYTELACLNIDSDSVILEYQNKKELTFTEPKVVAALASPPYWNGVTQDTGYTSTVFGQANEQTDESAHGFGVEVGFSIGYSLESPIVGSAASSMFKTNIKGSFDKTTTEIISRSSSRSFLCPAGENQVIITTVPFDVYYYTVVSSPETAEILDMGGAILAIGDEIAINIPRKPQMVPLEQNTFNKYFENVIDIGTDVFSHSFGDPFSYPSRSERDTMLTVASAAGLNGDMITTDMMTVGQGGGTQELTMSLLNGTATGTEIGLATGIEFESVSGGVLTGGSIEFSSSYSYTVSTSNETSITGMIANIYPTDWNLNLLYSTGIFACPVQKDGQKFVSVTYWVE